MAAIELRAVSFTYPGQTAPALDGIDLRIERGAFFVLCGPSGSGKSTLLRQLVPDLAPHGTRSGELLFDGAPLAALDRRTRCQRIGFVGQSPEDQLVTDKVWHELAFGLESLGLDDAVIRRRVAEMAAFFGIEGWFRRDVADLSGGQKQLLVLAAALVTGPTWCAGWTSRCGVESCWRSWAATGPGNRPPSPCWRACWPPSAAP